MHQNVICLFIKKSILILTSRGQATAVRRTQFCSDCPWAKLQDAQQTLIQQIRQNFDHLEFAD